jgi:hypothetical protein
VKAQETYTIDLGMAADDAGSAVSLEAAHVYIDSSTTPCREVDEIAGLQTADDLAVAESE